MPINMSSFPLKLFRQSRELAWDPTALDFSQDKRDWEKLGPVERDFLVRMVIGFLVGERGVTHDLAPLQIALRAERGRMEEEMYLATQLHEEAQHVEFFQLWMDQVLPGVPGADIPFPTMRGTLFRVELPETMGALVADRSPRAQLRASALYHQIVEGVIGETGYQIFYDGFERNGVMPGLLEGIHHVQRDEVRHIAFGTYLCQRLIRENPELETVFDEAMEEFGPFGLGMPESVFEEYRRGAIPFGIDVKRIERVNEQLLKSRIHYVKKGQLAAV